MKLVDNIFVTEDVTLFSLCDAPADIAHRADVFKMIADAGIAENEIELKSEEYFVLGDNCNSSEDSRSGNIGPVKKEHIEGEAWFRMASGDSSMGLIE